MDNTSVNQVLKNESSLKGKKSYNWKGGKTINARGYILRHDPHNGKAANYTKEHILIVEAVLGKKLPLFAVVHHFDGNTFNNNNSNLIICENQSYHILLHQRQRALRDSGNANMLKCSICKKYDFPKNMYILPNGQGRHRKCHSVYESTRKAKK